MTGQEIVLSLCKLSLPKTLVASKITLSAQLFEEQVFIQQERILKNGKVNFFRQNIFLLYVQKDLIFRIYIVSESGARSLVKTLQVSAMELRITNMRPISFKIEADGFELTWDSWLFSQDSEDEDTCTDRNYSELNFSNLNPDYQSQDSSLIRQENQTQDSSGLTGPNECLRKQESQIEKNLYPILTKKFSVKMRQLDEDNCENLMVRFKSDKAVKGDQKHQYCQLMSKQSDLCFNVSH